MHLLATLLLACRHAPPAPGTAPGDDPAEAGISRLALPGLRDVACASPDAAASTPDACVALVPGGLRAIRTAALHEESPPLPAPEGIRAFDTLGYKSGAWTVEGACAEARCARALTLDPPALGEPSPAPALPALTDEFGALDVEARAFTAVFNQGTRNRWRTGFSRLVVGPGGGLITWVRGSGGAGQLMRVGAGSTFVRVPAAESPVSYPAWLALHPTGAEVYLLPWPTTVLTAVDPMTLRTRWTVALEGAGRGLFLDESGRWLLAEVGSGTSETYVDWPIPRPAEGPLDPFRDEVQRALPRPAAVEVVVIDVATKRVAVRAGGTFRRWLALADGRRLLATDREVVVFRPPPAE